MIFGYWWRYIAVVSVVHKIEATDLNHREYFDALAAIFGSSLCSLQNETKVWTAETILK